MHGEEDKEVGKKITPLDEVIVQLDEEELLFLDSIKNDTPKQKLIKIEQYVRTHSFYDQDNKEVMEVKRGKSLDERMYICSRRVEELKDKNPELTPQLEGKKWAGVCADFANITVAMLRKAGFLCGQVSGFLPSGPSVMTTNAHGVAYAIMPDEKGHNALILVDGTPHGSSGDRLSLAEQDVVRTEQEKQIEEELVEKLDEIEKVISSGDKQQIDKILSETFNGNLEDMLNVTLTKEVRTTHYHHLQNLLNAYRYSPLKEGDLSSADNQSFIQEQMQREEWLTRDYRQEAKAWTMLFDMTEQFITRFTKEGGDKYQALDRLESIIEACQNLLTTTEYKSVKIISKYLRAENIKWKKNKK